ncbi:unnamed protein product [Peniophora sp. CBMAI 1063]|nr:unnamed protein product [Peniophora sp. CBMAI 1063]
MSLEDTKSQYAKPEDLIWDTYLKAAQREDEARPKNWEGNTTGILTFTGLFAATVAAFIIESYKDLSADPGNRTNVLLEHLIAAMANASAHNPVTAPPQETFSVAPTAIVTNAFWFSSLLIALVCALLSTLVQEWSRNYAQDISGSHVEHENFRTRAFNHIYIRMGVNRYGMNQFVSWIVMLMHVSVFFFACGLLVFLFPINHIIASVATGVISIFIIIYLLASLLPLIDPSCPYRTPLSYMMALAYWVTLRVLSICMPRLWPRNEKAIRMEDPRRLIERQYAGYHWEFMTDTRFVFAWDYTYEHISDESFETFLVALPSVFNRPSIWSRLCSDLVFMRRLWLYLDGLHRGTRSNPSSLLIETGVLNLVACLSDRMYALEVEQYGQRLEEDAYTSAYCLDVLGSISQLTVLDGPSQLSACLCLAHARWSLLKRCQAAFKQKMPVIDVGGVPKFFREASRSGFRLEGDRHGSPCGVLLLLISGSYRNRSWEHKSTSSLVPLHDGDCCRSWTSILMPKGLGHIAACNALSTVAYLLRSSEEQRRNARGMKVNINIIAEKWDASFYMDDTSRGMPSREFVEVLHLAGLEEWLEPDSEYVTGPAEGPNRRFLTNTFQGKSCVRALRNLAQKVDFEAYRARPVLRFPMPQLPPSSSGAERPMLTVAPAMPTPALNISPYNVFPLPDGTVGRYVVQQESPTRTNARLDTRQSPSSGSGRDNDGVFLVDAVRQTHPDDDPSQQEDALSGSSDPRTLRRISRRLGTVYTRYDPDITHDGIQPRSPYANEDLELDTLVPLLAGAGSPQGAEADWGVGHGSPRLMSVAIIDDRLHVGTLPGDVEAAAATASGSFLQRGWGEYWK